MPTTLKEAWVEFMFWEKLGCDREAFGTGYGDPEPWVSYRSIAVERQLDTMPATSLSEIRIRLSWMDWLNARRNALDPEEEAVRLGILRADIERMGKRLREQDSSDRSQTASVQNGHPHRTNADKRRDVAALLFGGDSLTDREIARRVGVSPQTVGNIRRRN